MANDSQPIWASNVHSTSYDVCFLEQNTCPNSTITTCSHTNDVSIKCSKFFCHYADASFYLLTLVAETYSSTIIQIENGTCATYSGKSLPIGIQNPVMPHNYESV